MMLRRWHIPHGRLGLGLLLLATLGTSGCFGSKGDVSGTVTFQGKHLSSGAVVIVGSDNQPMHADIQADGSYKVEGVPVGQARITVHSPDPALRPLKKKGKAKSRPDDRAEPPAGSPNRANWFPIPARYGNLDQSGLSVSVNSGPNTHNITLKE
jgi:hypothetical protein